MEAMSPVFAALGVSGCDALNDLAHWLDGDSERASNADKAGWASRLADRAIRAAGHASGREG